ncbi:hypothetical protein GCM10027447_16380 [Glycomyces halotolerans]
MRRVLIAAAAVAALAAAGCGGEEEPEAPDTEATEAGQADAAEQWESAGELDNMPPEATADLEPPIAPEAITTAFADAGLSDGESTDLGVEDENCDLTDCVRAFNTGDVKVMIYMSEEMAEAAATEIGDTYFSGPVVLHYAANDTPIEDKEGYETALKEVLAQ